MKLFLAAGLLAFASQAEATSYKALLTGFLTQQTSTGTSDVYHVGSTFTLKATFTDSDTVQTPYGYKLAGLYPTEFGQASKLSITSAGGSWIATDEQNDGEAFYTYDYYAENLDGSTTSRHYELALPGIAFAGGKVLAFAGEMIGRGETPVMFNGRLPVGFETCGNLEPGGSVQCQSTWSPANLSSGFNILGNTFLYDNMYLGPDFHGEWDFANSSVVAVPEPTTWALLIVGFGMTGSAMRRRRVAHA